MLVLRFQWELVDPIYHPSSFIFMLSTAHCTCCCNYSLCVTPLAAELQQNIPNIGVIQFQEVKVFTQRFVTGGLKS